MRSEGRPGARSYRGLEPKVKILDFTQCEMGSQWKVLRKGAGVI